MKKPSRNRPPPVTSSDRPIDRVLDALRTRSYNPLPKGPGKWKSCCPAHDDTNPSLDITETSDGTVLLKCWSAGCTCDQIVEKLGLEKKDLFPPAPDRKQPPAAEPAPAKDRNGRGFRTPELALAGACKQEEGTLSKLGPWIYVDAAGGEMMRIYRIDKADGKKAFRPVFQDISGRWHVGDPMKSGLPLYHLDQLAPAETIYLAEGEKCADLVRGLGLVATTSSHGAISAHKTDWTPLAGKTVVVMPDVGEAGEKYLVAATGLLDKLEPRPVIKVLRLRLANDGDDIEQWLAAQPDTWDADQCKAELERLAAELPEWIAPVPRRPILDSRDKKWASCLSNSLLWLEEEGLASEIRYDTFRQIILVKGEPLSDEKVIFLTDQIEQRTRKPWSQEHVRSALMGTAHRNQFSSLTQWLDSLAWDGVARVRRFFSNAYGCLPTEYTAACADVLFLSAVNRAYVPGCQADVMPVLIGLQGIRKSQGIKALCPDPLWFTDDLGADLCSKDAAQGLAGKWLIEFGEFSRINRSTIDVVKAFISRATDHYRPPYGRIAKDFPRTCIFAGTTNNPQPLNDDENRRFMPIHCAAVDVEWIGANRDQLWAEAVHLFRGGARGWVSVPGLLDQVREKQEEARQPDAWEDILRWKFENYHELGMEDVVVAIGIEIGRLDMSMQVRIGKILAKMGFRKERPRVDGVRQTKYLK